MVTDQFVRVFFDANVLLQGALGRRNHIRDVLSQPSVQPVTTAGVVYEVDSQIARHATDRRAKDAAQVFKSIFLVEANFEIADVYSPASEGEDLRHARAAAALGCDWICTYNIKDFSGSSVPVRTPRGLLRALDALRHLIEYPRLGEQGTLLVSAAPSKPGLGKLVVSDNGTAVVTDDDGFVVVQTPDGDLFRAREPMPPPGYRFNFSFRYDSSGAFDASLWVDDEFTYVPPGLTPGSGGRVELLAGFAPFGATSRVLFIFGANYGFAGSLFGVTGIDRWVREATIRRAIIDGTFDFVWSASTSDLLQRIEIQSVAASAKDEVLVMTLRSPNERVVLPIPPR